VKWAETHVRTCPACSEQFPEARKKLEHIFLRAILDGSEPVDPCDLDRVDSHARRCEECRLEHPDVLGELAKIRQEAAGWAAKNLEAIKHEFLSKKHALLAGVGSSDWELFRAVYEEVVGLLRSASTDIDYQLEYIHEIGGLARFRVVVAEEDSEEAELRRLSAPFINSLPKDTQEFIFTATLASELDTEGNPHKYCDVLEVAAAEYLSRYIEEQAERIRQSNKEPRRPEVEKTREGKFSALLDEKLLEFKDDLDSVKAVQMAIFTEQESSREILTRLESSNLKSADLEPFIRERLGRMHDRLELNTPAYLREAEYEYRHSAKSGTYRYAIVGFGVAYEAEFIAKIIFPFAAHIIKQGITSYPPKSKERYAIVFSSRINESLALGEGLRYLYDDKDVQNFVKQQGIDIHKLRETADKLRLIRNSATHPRNCNEEQAQEIRNCLLGPESILRFLLPKEAPSTDCAGPADRCQQRRVGMTDPASRKELALQLPAHCRAALGERNRRAKPGEANP